MRSIPIKFEICQLSLQVKARLQTIALKEHLVRKEKFALPPYCKEVSKKQALKDCLSFFVVSSVVETAEPLNACTIKDFTAKLRISNRNHFMC